jgi:hypothetical protein
MHEPVRVPTLPPDLVAGADISWARLITGVVLLVLSLVMGYRSAHHPPPPKAQPHPVRNQLIVSADLPPLEPAVVGGVRTIPDISAAPALATAKRVGPAREPAPHFKHAARPRWPAHAHWRRHGNARVVARSSFVRTRAEVRREYFRDRDFVAAFGGEDSGSVYLTRIAGERRGARSRGRVPRSAQNVATRG